MKKIILVCLLLISVAESQHLDWKWINPYPSWNDLYQTTFVDSTTGFIRGMKDIYKTTDKGNIWKKVEINFKHNYISSLYFQNQSTGWMSIDSKLLKTTDCGETWEIMNDTLGGTVQFINAKDGFLSSSSWYDYTFYRTSDGGKTWKYISTFQSKINGEQLTINSNKFLDTLNGFACGSGVTSNGFYYGYIYRTTDGGLTWSKKETTPHYLNSIYFVNDSIGWTTGDYNSLLKTTDRGNNWGTVALDYKDLNLKGIHFSDPKNGIITENDHGALMTSDGGLNWW